jgi:hypothetical protein
MMTQAEMKTELVITVLEETRGNLTMAAKRIGCARNTLYSFINSHPTCLQALDAEREKMIDNVESTLYSKALEGEGWAVCFFLKTQGKRRGYVERQEITGADGHTLEVRIIDDSA